MTTAPAHRKRQATRPAHRSVFGLVVATLVGLVSFGWIRGWRVHEMTTPSMGTAEPVGTLVLSRPVDIAAVHAGQIIAFHPPGRSVAFVHRILTMITGPQGVTLHTKGDINPAPDVWTLHQGDLIGRAVMSLPDGGFLLQMVPLLLAGTFVILLLTSGMHRQTRGPFRLALGSLLVSLLLFRFHPLERIALLEQQITTNHGVASVVPTGVLPLRVQAIGGSRTNLVPGQPGTVTLGHVRFRGHFAISSTVHLTGWWWAVLLIWLVPIVIGLTMRRQPQGWAHLAPGGPSDQSGPTSSISPAVA